MIQRKDHMMICQIQMTLNTVCYAVCLPFACNNYLQWKLVMSTAIQLCIYGSSCQLQLHSYQQVMICERPLQLANSQLANWIVNYVTSYVASQCIAIMHVQYQLLMSYQNSPISQLVSQLYCYELILNYTQLCTFQHNYSLSIPVAVDSSYMHGLHDNITHT